MKIAKRLMFLEVRKFCCRYGITGPLCDHQRMCLFVSAETSETKRKKEASFQFYN